MINKSKCIEFYDLNDKINVKCKTNFYEGQKEKKLCRNQTVHQIVSRSIQLFCLPCKLDKFRNYQFDFAYFVSSKDKSVGFLIGYDFMYT